MISEIIPTLSNMFSSLLAYCFSIYEEVGAISLVFGAFMIYTIYRFILQPILGGGVSSDKASKKVTQKNEEN